MQKFINYFNKNKLNGGVIKEGKVGAGFKRVVGKAHLHGAASNKLNKKKKVKSNKKIISRYPIMDNGEIFYINDYNGTETKLRADKVNSIYIGKSNIRNSTRQQKFRKPNYLCLEQSVKYESIFKEYEVDVNKCIIVDGCYYTNMVTLQRQMIPEVQGVFSEYPSEENISEFDGTVLAVLRKLKGIKQQERCDESDILNVDVALDKKPGYRYEECLKQKTKLEAIDTAYKYAVKRWNIINELELNEITRDKIIPGVYTIGARSKRDFTYEPNERAVSRVVHMPELHVELCSAPWVDQLTDELKENKDGPIYIGNSLLEWHRLSKDLQNSKYVIEGDWKRFDSTLYIRIITVALAIMRTMFTLDDENIDKHFLAMYDTLAIKDYYMIKGNVYRMFHGLPSGVKSTSILGSIINLIALIHCVGHKNAKKFNFIVGGDDFLVVNNSSKISSENLIKQMEDVAGNLGMIFKVLEKKDYNSRNINKCPTFYKYCVYNGRPMVPPAAMLERVFMPWNKNYSNKFKYLSFLWDVMPSLGTPMSHLFIYYDTLQRTIFSCTNKVVSITDLISIHENVNKRMMERKDVSLLQKYRSNNDVQRSVSHALLINKMKNYRMKIFDESLFNT